MRRLANLFFIFFSLLGSDATSQSFVPVPPDFGTSVRNQTVRRPTYWPIESVLEASRVAAASEVAIEALERMKARNASGERPVQIGFIRYLRSPIEYERTSHAIALTTPTENCVLVKDVADRHVIALRVVVEGSLGARLLVEGEFPDGTEMWVWGASKDPVSFRPELENPTWSPTVWGGEMFLQISTPRVTSQKTRIRITQLADIQYGFATENVAAAATECFQDASCYSSNTLDVIDVYRRAVAALITVDQLAGTVGYCTGALVTDRAHTKTPFLLTANHCVSNAAQASATEAFFDVRTTSCGGQVSGNYPRASGATLLTTSAQTDFTLLRLNVLPAGAALMGWDPRSSSVPVNTDLYRISHPYSESTKSILPQTYSRSRVASVPSCPDWPKPQYLYSEHVTGSVDHGSSGGPVILQGGYVVGQLAGACGSNLTNPCDQTNSTVDGSFAASWPLIATYLDPPTTCDACVPTSTTACLLGNRFKVTVPVWRDLGAKLTGEGLVIRYAENSEEVHPEYGPLSGGVYFSMYSFSPKSVEVLARLIKGQNINNKFWIFATGFTGAEYTLRVQDTRTCKIWERTVAAGATNVVKDFEAFPFP